MVEACRESNDNTDVGVKKGSRKKVVFELSLKGWARFLS